MSRALNVSTCALRATPVPDNAARDSVLDERHALPGDAFEVERLRQAARIERIVPDAHLLVENALAEPPSQVAPLLEQAEASEGIPREVLQQVGQCVRLEHGAVHLRLDFAGALRSVALLRCLGRARARIDAGDRG